MELESKNKFVLNDRWFYLINDTDSKLFYSSIPSNQNNAITVILDKETYEVTILNMKKKNTTFIINTSDIRKDEIKFKLKEIEPQQIEINDNIYVNLILESNIVYKGNRIDKENLIISKKKNMKKLCYCEPNFKLDEPINIKDVDIYSGTLDFFLDITESIALKKYYIIKYMDTKTIKEEIEIKKSYKELYIPNRFYFYDRIYKLIKSESDKITYSNDEDYYNELEFKIDPIYKNLTGLRYYIREFKNNKEPNYILKIDKDIIGNRYVKFESVKKVKLLLSNELLENASFKVSLEFDKEAKMTGFIAKINHKKTTYNLMPHPIHRYEYLDEEGNEYRIVDRDFCYLLGLSTMVARGIDHYEKVLAKEVEQKF